MNIHIIQCDDTVQSDQKITNEEELRAYMDDLELKGEGGTDFRPAFAHVEKLLEQKEFSQLRGLIYFTDGQGVYPKKMPPYETAFVFMKEDYEDVNVPAWAMKLILNEEDVRKCPENQRREKEIQHEYKASQKEIQDSVTAYLKKDSYGEYMIPSIRQRPILLMGPPGIGKTQIMEQVARHCGIALVSYTITHHTRQSAVGLPFIREKTYGEKTYSVTEYTMSEIISSVYEKMEETGLKRESSSLMRSTASRRHWRLLCCSFCSAKRSAIRKCRKGGSSWQPEIRRSTINPCGNLMW